MPKAQMIRADTIDLQDQHSPSAGDHTHQPHSPSSIGDGPPAPHQAAALRHASLDESSLLGRSPRASQDLSGKELQLLHEQHSDVDEQDAADIEASLGIQRGADPNQNEIEGEEDEGEDMDDDMMDKISSSPSIDDGGYSQVPLADVEGSPSQLLVRTFLSADFEAHSSSPFMSTPEHFPLGFNPREAIQAATEESAYERIPGGYPASARSRSESGGGSSTEEAMAPSLSPSGSMLSWVPLVDDDGEPFALEGDIPGANYTPKPSLDLATPVKASSVNSSLLSFTTSPETSAIEPCDDENDPDEANFFDEERFLDSGWGGESLREPEDIDFEFVYALHTFVATVEGQANATKGDTMVLLDDSNSYWWLVRVVKDSSIGYLPAEHIETPTERLARLNKHRNIDLSQTMLSDNPERSRNPLKKKMRRRNVKTVQFTDPTYYEAEQIDYSSEEEGEDDMEFLTTADAAHDDDSQHQQDQHQTLQQQQHAQHQDKQQQQLHDSDYAENAVQPLRIRGLGSREERQENANGTNGNQQGSLVDPRIDRPRISEESAADSEDSNGQRNTRRMRNTDSFYKDDSIETRKISLTPNLLRDSSTSPNPEGPDSRASLESSEKQAPVAKPKEEKKKKPSKFSGLFKRRDRKSKQQNEEETDEFLGKRDQQQQKDQPNSGRTSPQSQQQAQAPAEASQDGPMSPRTSQQPTRQTSKLQKAPPTGRGSSLRRTTSQEEVSARSGSQLATDRSREQLASVSENDPFDDSAATSDIRTQRSPNASNNNSRSNSRVTSPTSDSLRNVFNPVRDAFRSTSSQQPAEPSVGGEGKPERVKKAKERMALDDSDESGDEREAPSINVLPAPPTRRPPEPYQAQATNSNVNRLKERLSESPVQVSPLDERKTNPLGAPGLVESSSHSSRDGISPVSPSESPELVDHPADGASASYTGVGSKGDISHSHMNNNRIQNDSNVFHTPIGRPSTPPSANANNASTSTTPASHSTSASRQPPQWNDAMLRSYLETSTDDIRDLLVVVGDTSGVAPPSADHPTVKSFDGDRKRLAAMDQKLDDMLKGLMARRGLGKAVSGS